eukprot:6136000-Prymnesium_polylepis.1
MPRGMPAVCSPVAESLRPAQSPLARTLHALQTALASFMRRLRLSTRSTLLPSAPLPYPRPPHAPPLPLCAQSRPRDDPGVPSPGAACGGGQTAPP